MGVSVLTMRGKTFSGRGSAAILTAIGLQSFIAETEVEYQQMAVKVSQDLDKLADLRTGLRKQVSGSEAGDPKQYAKAVEKTYRNMWRRWCEQQV